jgi:hypothetical protein
MKYQFAVLIIAYAGSFAYIYRRYNDHLPLKKYLSNHVSSEYVDAGGLTS